MGKVIKRIVYLLIQWTWGLPQNLLAGLLYVILYRSHQHETFHQAYVTFWNHPYSMGCGMFIFQGDYSYSHLSAARNAEINSKVLLHEYGHTVQSLILGPLYLPVIALPSLLWAGLPMAKRWRKKHTVSYYKFYTENWANKLSCKCL